MKWFGLAVALVAMGCDQTQTIWMCGDGNENTAEAAAPFLNGDGDPPGVVQTCDDYLPCTVDIQCTPCSLVPEEIRYIKATCTPDNKLSEFCFNSATGIPYTGCTHFAADPTPQGVSNACFPVQFPDDPEREAHPGVCNAFGQCVENPTP